jgi:hypothetical protein
VLTIQDVDNDYISAHQTVPYSFIQSKTDAVQISFYVAIAGSMDLPASITPAEFYSDVNTVFQVTLHNCEGEISLIA